MRIFGVILAGGGARRMGGQDKALLTVGGQSLLARTYARMSPQVERIAVSANGDGARFGAEFTVLPDVKSQGPLSGILAALNWARPFGASAVVSVAVDTPFFPADLVPRLCAAAETSPDGVAIATSAGGHHPTFGLWPIDLLEPLHAFLVSGVTPRVMDFARTYGVVQAAFGDEGAFVNLNTPDDLAAAEAMIRGRE